MDREFMVRKNYGSHRSPKYSRPLSSLLSFSPHGRVFQPWHYWHLELDSLCCEGLSCVLLQDVYLVASLVITNYMPVAKLSSPNCDNQKCLQVMPNVTNSLAFEGSQIWTMTPCYTQKCQKMKVYHPVLRGYNNCLF